MKQNRATLFGLPNSPEAYELRDFLKRSGFPFEWIDLKTDDDARRLAGVTGLHDPRLPVCVMEKGSVLFRPTIRDLAAALDWFRGPKHDRYDLAIYGAGPAGLSAAVYGASEGLRTIVLEQSAVGGQAGSTSRIDNYLGFPDGISGWELASRARQQAQRLGAEIIVTAEGVGGETRDGWTVSWLSGGQEIVARATICATGVEYSRLGLVNEENYLGRGLFYGAGSSEASRCTGRVFIVGGGNSAGQAALNFSRFATTVTMLVRGESLKETLSTYLVEQIEVSSNIEILINTTLVGLDGANSLESITYRNEKSGEVRHASTHWIFVCIGGAPRTDWAKPGTLLTDAAGYVLTGDDLIDEPLPPSYWASHSRKPMFMETSMPGLFAAGDVRHNSVKRCATAVGDGATAVSMVHQYLALESRLSLRSATGISPERCSRDLIQQASGPLAGRNLLKEGERHKMKAIHLTAYGNPAQNLQMVEVPEPNTPSAGEALVRMEYAPVDYSDLLLANGVYFLNPQLPSVIGGEGAGIVEAIGSGVTSVKVGDRVTIPFPTFTWAEKVLAPADGLFVVPPAVDPKTASMLNINPTTAVLLLDGFVKLKPKDWVVLNAANSQVARCIIAIAKSRDLNVVGIVRRSELIQELERLGVDFVGVESPELPKQIQSATGGMPISLGLDAVGGPAAATIAGALSPGAHFVSYAWLGGLPIHLPQGDLIGKRLNIRGFWMYYEEFLPKIRAALTEATQVVASGRLSLPIMATYKPFQIKEAIEHYQRGGKVLLDFTCAN